MGKMTAIGTRFESYLVDLFVALGWDSKRLPKRGIKGESDLFATKNGIMIQVQAKERQRLAAGETLMTLISSLDVEGVTAWSFPVVIWKRVVKKGQSNRRMQEGPIMAILPLDDYLMMVERLAERGDDS